MTDANLIVRKSHKSSSVGADFTLTPDFSGVQNSFMKFRQKAWEVFQTLPFPTPEDEAWRRTNISNLALDQLLLPDPNTTGGKIPGELFQPMAGDYHSGQILLSNARTSSSLDSDLFEKGVIFTDLQNAQYAHPELLEKILNNTQTWRAEKFAAMAAAFGKNGILLYIPKGIQVEKPFHSLIWTTGSGLLNANQIFVWLEEGASATYVHETSSSEMTGVQNLHAGLMEIHVCAGARLNFVELQSYGQSEWNFNHENVVVESDGEVDWVFGSLGSHLTKNFSDLNLVGRGSKGKMSGFYFTNGKQHLDHDTQQNHLAPDTTSDLLFKGALLGESRSVWQGMIYVAENAARTDGYQANRNLVLSEKARADSIPGLEILTDDVRCSHGATVGKIDADQVFYLESRGIPRKEAEKLIVEGFFDPIMQRIPFNGVRNRFLTAIEEKMKDY